MKKIEKKINKWFNSFRKNGLRITESRKAVLKILVESEEHLSAEDVYMKVHEIYPSIGLTTVYRTLELFTNTGIVNKFEFGDGRARYEVVHDSETEKHHHHLICKNCGKIIDYFEFMNEEKELIKKTEDKLSERYKFDIERHIIQFYGICSKCRKE